MSGPEPIGYTVAMYDMYHPDEGALLFPEGNDVFATQAEAEDYRGRCLPSERYRYVVVALVPCGETPQPDQP